MVRFPTRRYPTMRPTTLIPAVLGLALAASPGARAEESGGLGHMVFFELEDASDAAVAKLVAACHEYLSGHEGTLHFSVGVRAKDLVRDVNQTDYHVALHLVFESRAAHDAYQSAPRHHQFIEENRANWKSVEVYDSDLAPGE
jgi:quinol monooxygenase YgiN